MKKIIVFEDSSVSGFGGGQRVTQSVLKALGSNYLVFDTSKSNPIFASSIFYPRLKLFSKKGDYQNLNIKFLQIFLLLPFLIFVNICVVFKLLKFRKEKLLFYCPTKYGLISCILSSLLFNTKIIFHAHNVYDRRIVSIIFLKIVSFFAYNIICVSKTVQNTINLKNSIVIPNPIPKISSRKIKDKKIRIGMVGNFFNYKGHNLFIEATRRLPKKNKKKISIVFFGSGDQKNEIAKASQNLEMSIFFKGSEIDINKIYQIIDIIIIPSIKPEAFSLVIGEAWSSNTLVIASDIGAHKELIKNGKNGYLFKNNDPIELSNILSYCIENLEFLSEVIAQAKFDVNLFSENNFNKKINIIWNKFYAEIG